MSEDEERKLARAAQGPAADLSLKALKVPKEQPPPPRAIRKGRITHPSIHVTWDQLDAIKRQILARADWEIAILAIASACGTAWRMRPWDASAFVLMVVTFVAAYVSVRKAFAARSSQALDIVEHHMRALGRDSPESEKEKAEENVTQ